MHEKPPVALKKLKTLKPGDRFSSVHVSKQSLFEENDADSQRAIHRPVLPSKYSEQVKHINTMFEIFQHGLSISPKQPCLAERSSTEVPYSWMSYEIVDRGIQQFGSALLDAVPYNADGDNVIGIYSKNCIAWVTAQLACAAYSYTYVPLYDTLGKAARRHILKETELKILLCYNVKATFSALENFLEDGTSEDWHIQWIVIVDEAASLEELKKKFGKQINFIYFSDFLKKGSTALKPTSPAGPDDLCTICYTSGSSGIPKGVKINHSQLSGTAKTMMDTVEGKYCSTQTVHFSYLPLAHIYEQALMAFVLLCGGKTGFCTAGRDTMLKDIHSVRPTFFAVVPQILTSLHRTYYQKLRFDVVRRVAKKYINRRLKKQAQGIYETKHPLDFLLFRSLRKKLGNNISGVICAGAPLMPEVNQFTRVALACPVLEGYGSTEATGLLTSTLIGDLQTGIVGTLSPDVVIKLADVPSMGISVEKNGFGEICAKGPRLTTGYYKNPEKTAELYDEDGFMHLGDLGSWTENGALIIKDRCKNMFKLAQGEYIAPEKVEGIYGCCPLILNVLVDGDSRRQFAVAVVHPNFDVLRAETSKKLLPNASELSVDELCANVEVKKFILGRMNEAASVAGLNSLEQAKSIHLIPDPFTIANGLLTPTLKIARYKAREHFRTVIEELYANGKLV